MVRSTTKSTLEDALKAAKVLPEEMRFELAEELVALVEDYQTLGLTPEQKKIVKERLSMPLEHILREDFLAMLRRDRKSTRLNSSHIPLSRMPSSA